MRRKTIAIAASVVAAVALVVIGAISAGAGPTRHAAPAGHVGKANASAAATVRRSFALFRRAARGKASTANVSTPRLASTGPHGKLYAYMQGSKLCTEYRFSGADPGTAGTCGDPNRASQKGVGLSVLGPEGETLAALLPDGVSQVTVDRGGGSEQVGVSNNGFVYSGPKATRWRFTSPDGSQDVEKTSNLPGNARVAPPPPNTPHTF